MKASEAVAVVVSVAAGVGAAIGFAIGYLTANHRCLDTVVAITDKNGSYFCAPARLIEEPTHEKSRHKKQA